MDYPKAHTTIHNPSNPVRIKFSKLKLLKCLSTEHEIKIAHLYFTKHCLKNVTKHNANVKTNTNEMFLLVFPIFSNKKIFDAVDEHYYLTMTRLKVKEAAVCNLRFHSWCQLIFGFDIQTNPE